LWNRALIFFAKRKGLSMKSSPKFLLLAFFVFGLFFVPMVNSEDQVTPPSRKMEKPIPNPVSAVVDAFVVEIDNCVLYDNPADLIRAKSDTMSVERVLGLIKANKGVKIVSFTRGCSDSGSAKVKERRTIIIEKEQGQGKQYIPYEIGTTFEVSASVSDDKGAVFVDYSLNQIVMGTKVDEKPEETINRNWNGNVSVLPGKPVIVGCNQECDKTLLLIIKAEIVETLPQ